MEPPRIIPENTPSLASYAIILTILLALGTCAIKNRSRHGEYEEKINKRGYIDSIYQTKKDSLENAYRLQLDSLARKHQTNLKNLESKFKNN